MTMVTLQVPFNWALWHGKPSQILSQIVVSNFKVEVRQIYFPIVIRYQCNVIVYYV